MDEKKNIDRLFQEKFKDFEVFPDASAWEHIEERLMKKKKRRIVPLWIRFGGAAAILLLLVSTSFWYYNRDTDTIEGQPNDIIITNTDTSNKTDSNNKVEEEISNTKETSITFKTPEVNRESESVTSKVASQNYLKKPKKNKQTNTFRNEEEVKNPSKENEHSIAKNTKNITLKIASQNPSKNLKRREQTNTFYGEEKTTNPSLKNKHSITKNSKEIGNKPVTENLTGTTTDAIVKTSDLNKEKLHSEKKIIAQEETVSEQKDTKTDIQEEIDKTKGIEETILKNKWSIGSIITPVYYNTLGNGSPIDPALANNTKNSDDTFSFGLKVNYKLSNKLSLQSGINTLELGYSTENVTTLISSSLLDGSNTNINTNVDGLLVAAFSTNSESPEASNQRSSFDVAGNLDQSLRYVEVPIEVKYNILQKKIGVHVIGGFSTYFLYDNKVSITSFGKTTTLGEASNINSLNFSGNLGVNLDYNISKKLYINVSPMFKYQFNTFSDNSGGFKPYYLGVYTGLNFRF